jgi:hypothetical protein
MDPRLFPGPSNSELLFLGNDHRAYHVFHQSDYPNEPLTLRRADQQFWKTIKEDGVPKNVMKHIDVAGFGGVLNCGYRMVDNHLITALVERWRPETHTFHFSFGEATVTLQDVQVLWGLPIGDDVISGIDFRLDFEQQRLLCYNMLGMHVDESDFRNSQLKLSSVLAALKKPFPANASTEECITRARVYILHLLGGTILPDSSGNCVYLHILPHLEDLEQCGRLSWANAVLACMYRNLCKASHPTSTEIYGPNVLLQLWAWERIRPVAPATYQAYNFEAPYAARYVNTKYIFNFKNDTHSSLE